MELDCRVSENPRVERSNRKNSVERPGGKDLEEESWLRVAFCNSCGLHQRPIEKGDFNEEGWLPIRIAAWEKEGRGRDYCNLSMPFDCCFPLEIADSFCGEMAHGK